MKPKNTDLYILKMPLDSKRIFKLNLELKSLALSCYQANSYVFMIKNRNTRKGVKYVQI